MDFAARLRREGAGPAGIRAALEERFPSLSKRALDFVSRELAAISPRAVVGATRRAIADEFPLLPSPDTQNPIPDTLPAVPIHSAAAFAGASPPSIQWIVEPWAAAGALTAITGRPKVGKTTFVLDLVAAVLAGRPFLPRPTASPFLPSPLEGEGPGMRAANSASPFPRGEGGQGVGSPPSPLEGRQGPPQEAEGPGMRVLYLTEQQPSSFRASLERAGLLSSDRLDIIFWHEVMDRPWPGLVAHAGDHCDASGARLLVVDTLSQWAGMRGDMENQAGDAFAVLQPLQQLAAREVAVIFVQHERKGGGDAADAGRGSSAFAGAVDTLISFRRPPHVPPSPLEGEGPGMRASLFPRGEGGQGVRSHPSPLEGEGPGMRAEGGQGVRLLLALSRFEAVPAQLYIQRSGGSYRRIAAPADDPQQAGTAILRVLPADSAAALTADQIMQASSAGRRALARAIEALRAAGLVARAGSGRRGDPFRYWATDSFPSPL